jgi:hypothetical protein
MAWAEHITLKNPTAEDMLAAVSKWYEEPHERVPLPADISIIAREFQRDRKSREPENVRRHREDIRDGVHVVELDEPRRERITMADWEARHGESFPKLAFQSADEVISDQRRAAFRILCRHCKAQPGSPCVTFDGRPLTKSPFHDCRLAEAEGRCAWWVGYHVYPHTKGCHLA